MKTKTIVLFCITLFCLIVINLVKPSFASSDVHSGAGNGLTPAALLKWPENGSDYAILVDKFVQKVYVYHRDDLSAPIRTYSASTGEVDGPKMRENDKKTPEGIYFITREYKDRDLAPRYGVRAFPIDYPNPLDKNQGKTGYGIWFHGLNKPLKAKDTQGCIALVNSNINELATFLKLQETPIVIGSKLKMVDAEEALSESRVLTETIERWKNAWEKKDIDDYMSFYHKLFTSNWRARKHWKKYKLRLARKYNRITVKIDNLRLLKYNGVVVATFDQIYSADDFRSYGTKRLYLQQNSKQWKITKEIFIKKDVRLAKFSEPVFDPQQIRRFVDAWKHAWERKDLPTYLSYYSPRFQSQGMGLKEWKNHKKRLNRKYRSIEVKISDLEIKEGSKNNAVINFRQHFRAGDYRDVGLKRLLLAKSGKHWRIVEEVWHPVGN